MSNLPEMHLICVLMGSGLQRAAGRSQGGSDAILEQGDIPSV